MNDKPAILIQFDPETWQIVALYFKTSTDRETERLIQIFTEGVSYDNVANCRGDYHA